MVSLSLHRHGPCRWARLAGLILGSVATPATAEPAVTAAAGARNAAVAVAAPEGAGAAAHTELARIDNVSIDMLSAPRWIKHVVVPRERLDQIAARYGVSIAGIKDWNQLVSDEIEKGSKLAIKARKIPPPRTRIEYAVGEQDTWRSIAIAHGVDPADLRAYNWRPGQKLVVGETLRIWVDPIVAAGVRNAADTEIRAGGISIGPPQDGRLVNGVQLPSSPLYDRQRSSSAYGTSHTIANLYRGLETFRARIPYRGRIVIGAISRPRGGPLGHHLSHQTGRDVDIRLPLKESIPQSLAPRPARRVDWLATYELARALADTGEVVVMFLDYALPKRLYRAAREAGIDDEGLRTLVQWPHGSASTMAIVRHSPGHDDHIHVRFRCGRYETECVEPEGDSVSD